MMIWIYIFTPIIILVGIAIYFDKKNSGATSPDKRTADKLEEYPPENPFGPNNF